MGSVSSNPIAAPVPFPLEPGYFCLEVKMGAISKTTPVRRSLSGKAQAVVDYLEKHGPTLTLDMALDLYPVVCRGGPRLSDFERWHREDPSYARSHVLSWLSKTLRRLRVQKVLASKRELIPGTSKTMMRWSLL